MGDGIEGARRLLLERLGLAEPPRAFAQALTHPSYANEQRAGAVLDNQRLEFLGDAVLDLCVSELLLTRLPEADEGTLSRANGALVNADSLATWARANGVAGALSVGKGAAATGIHEQTNVLADAVEAVLAAVYLDGGLPEARRVTELIVGAGIADAAELCRRDAKTTLQERVQAGGGSAPSYRLLRVEGTPHDRRFLVGVEVSGATLAEGRGRSKKLAEQAAARAALELLDEGERTRRPRDPGDPGLGEDEQA